MLFILALGGLSNQETARRGNVFGTPCTVHCQDHIPDGGTRGALPLGCLADQLTQPAAFLFLHGDLTLSTRMPMRRSRRACASGR